MDILKKTLVQIEAADRQRMKKKENELNSLLKTPKGLGIVEDLAIKLEGMQKNYRPKKKMVLVMAADNGVECEKVSKSKRVITQYVVEAMSNGTSSINSLAKSFGADVKVVDLGIDESSDHTGKINLSGIIQKKLMPFGTNNILNEAAMSYETSVSAIEIGIETVNEFVKEGYNLFATGEMGIGNTSTSSAILKVFSDLPLDDIVGFGSGIDKKTLEHKKEIIKRAILTKKIDKKDPIDVLSKVGGLDIAGMAGTFLGCAKNGVPVVIDGFISAVAALIAYKLCPNARDYMIGSHLSCEPGMKYIMNELNLTAPLLMNMKLGEGTGAIMMFPIIEAACRITEDVRTYPDV
ncbi:nicotinate-nucleotide--dimethylbenzimidazole phosphoribosyltransferase [Leptotrichia sp. oral taxon 847]|uniref:nicotinate-nucleotide--dimethylbenzimidazole phosphoribosyltransferase n=1 Tax=Leptotrichia sp. oral taxon 847 TaxID=1785996 RepID=UPI0007681AA1|nr:nicotinate-nucleotide--dimethylbenzimidazole phosphoribosyltransferase [Leptotrichia sp. oral taxon 847]AMD95111.1 nicotinate-nucleotide--dimethylbenzimidazole phosphoribosyltransferase [Leptotrichia sp. oral taxon 847]